MAAVYLKKPVLFSANDERKIGTNEPVVIVPFAGNPYLEDGSLLPEAKEALLQIVEWYILTSRFRCCVVLTENSCVYLEPSVTRNTSNEPPSGGVQLDHLLAPGEEG